MSGHAQAPSVYVVIPVRNRWAFTQACLDSLRAQTYPKVLPVVIDDGSSDCTAERLRAEYPDVELLSGDGNLWWTGATVMGVDRVLQRCEADDFILLLNNDTVVDPDYVATLVRTFDEHGGRALVGSVGVDARDRATISDGGPRVQWASARWESMNTGHRLAEIRAEGVSAVAPSVLPGRGTLVPTGCFREVGGFDAAHLPHYGADYEFSARAARAGYELVMTYEAPVYSEVEATGPSSAQGRLPWRTFLGTYVSRRSPACLLYRWRFGRRAAPPRLRAVYLVADTARVIGSGLRAQFRGSR